MIRHPEIKRFVRETLGCSCPDEVFRTIDRQVVDHGFRGKRINVGDRLLIYLITMADESGIHEVVRTALEQGVGERERMGFNRFRLVLASPRPEELHGPAGRAFEGSEYRDERTHLHIVNECEVAGL
jgi:hypothetical protein